MMLFKYLEKLTFKQTIFLSLSLTVVMAVPLTFFLIGQKNKSEIRRLSHQFTKPLEILEREVIPPGPIPDSPPEIGRVFPWVGKEADVIWIQGKNLGDNPVEKSLVIGGRELGKDKIISWRDTQIQAIIPKGAQQGGTVIITVGNYPAVGSLPYVLYDRNTMIQLKKAGSRISMLNGQDVRVIRYFIGDEKTPTEMIELNNSHFQNTDTFLFEESRNLLSILLFNNRGQMLPYYVNPDEFGF